MGTRLGTRLAVAGDHKDLQWAAIPVEHIHNIHLILCFNRLGCKWPASGSNTLTGFARTPAAALIRNNGRLGEALIQVRRLFKGRR